MTGTFTYRRLLFSLQPGPIDPSAFRAAADLARSLNLEMLAILVEDRSIIGAASLPFARELRLPTHDWQPANPQRLALELQAAAESARLQLARESLAVGIDCRFEVTSGDPGTALVELSGLHDIIAVTEPGDTIGLLEVITDRMRQAALASEATVLLLPRRSAASPGPVVVLVENPADPGLMIAAAIAGGSARDLLVLTTMHDPHVSRSVQQAASAAGLPLEKVEVAALGSRAVSSVLHALVDRRGCFLVTNRATSGLPAAALNDITSGLGMPILVIEPVGGV